MTCIYCLTTTRHLEEVVPLKLFKDGSLQFDKVIRHHDSEQGLAVRVDSHIESDGLDQDHDSMENWNQTQSQEKMVKCDN